MSSHSTGSGSSATSSALPVPPCIIQETDYSFSFLWAGFYVSPLVTLSTNRAWETAWLLYLELNCLLANLNHFLAWQFELKIPWVTISHRNSNSWVGCGCPVRRTPHGRLSVVWLGSNLSQIPFISFCRSCSFLTIPPALESIVKFSILLHEI